MKTPRERAEEALEHINAEGHHEERSMDFDKAAKLGVPAEWLEWVEDDPTEILEQVITEAVEAEREFGILRHLFEGAWNIIGFKHADNPKAHTEEWLKEAAAFKEAIRGEK